MPAAAPAIPVVRNLIEYAAIIAWWGVMLVLHATGAVSPSAMCVLVVVGCWSKTVFFGTENMRQLFDAARTNMPHHRFLMLMGVNTSQMILAFTLDFHLLHRVDVASFTGIASTAGQAELLFNFFGSSGNSGKRRTDFQEEVRLIAIAIRDAFEDFDLVVAPFEHAGVDREAAVTEDAVEMSLQHRRERP